ncbi:MAG: hypothetical protein ACFFDF_14785 [Candidatus Odinarchaeota archaeon]
MAKVDKIKSSHQLIYIALIISPIMYFLILLVLQITVLDDITIPANIFSDITLNLLLLVFIFLTVATIVFTYIILIPLAQKEEKIQDRFIKNFLILVFGSNDIAIYGFILGLIWWSEYNFVPLFLVVIFLGSGMIHGVFLYYRYGLNVNTQKEDID